MDKSYEPHTFESTWYAHWEASGCFAPRGTGTPYTVLLPPPNVTGTLHMGHAFQHTLMDALVRYHRMRGYDTLWQMGTDHAGIATEMVVGRNLARDNITRDDLGRDTFIEKVWEWKQASGDTIERQMRRLGVSGDLGDAGDGEPRKVFTMDAMPSRAVVEAFVRMYEEGLIYRGQRLVNWDPVLKTAISDLEVVSEEEDGFLWSIFYPFTDSALRGADGKAGLTVATTRPETMLGDVAVAVHPDDERYAHLVGRTLRLPLTGREIPIIADAYVERDFGTGCVKITPAHDFNDYAIGQRHSLPTINIFDDSARIITAETLARRLHKDAHSNFVANDHVFDDYLIPTKYQSLDRYEARKIVLADLETAGALIETKPHKLQVPRGDRTGQVIEPYLTDQWFVKMDTLAARGLAIVESGAVQFVPPNWINTYRHWMGNIQDWCISRQLWWGHRIPAWYGSNGRAYVGRDLDEARTRAVADGYLGQLTDADRDNDVLETWFSSALWPFSTMGWPDPDAMQRRGYDRYLPSSVLVTGFDIIFFWVARMIMMTDHFTGEVPFKHVYITGLIRDKDGQKMSKSKGNVLDPLDLIDGITLDALVAKRTSGLMQPQMAAKIEKATRREFPDGIPAFGADPLRFTFAALAGHGRDIKFDLGRAEGYKNFCNKLWNAARFVLMNCEGFAASGAPTPSTDAERWILARLARTTAEVHAQFAAYRFDLVSQALYEFTWNELCDWFLELSKPALQGDDRAAAESTRHTLLHVLEAVLRLLHPLLPFVTEEIWQHVKLPLGIAGDSISTQPYPENVDAAVDPDSARAEADVEWLRAAITALRRVRSELNVAPNKQVPLLLQGGSAADRARATRFDASLRFLNRLESIRWLDPDAAAPAASAALLGELKLLIPIAGLIDLGAERARLEREITRVQGEIGKCRGKLGSDTFVANAPAAVVATERQRLSDWSVQLDGLRGQLEQLATL